MHESDNDRILLIPPTSKLPLLQRTLSNPLNEIRASLAYLRILYSPEVRGSRRRRKPVPSDASHSYLAGLEEIRADKFERDYATRWLVGLISAAQDESNAELHALVEDASSLLALWAGPASSGQLIRTFTFGPSPLNEEVRVTLTDAPLDNADYGTLGAQTWGGACVMSDLIVENPGAFGIPESSVERKLRILELGAGTGLVGLTIGHLLHSRNVNSEVVLTDFHPSILKNLKSNVEANFPNSARGPVRVTATQLDWSKFPSDEALLSALATFDIIVGSDIIYEEEHAVWIKACLEILLSGSAHFYLLIPLRSTHKMESSTISTVFGHSSTPAAGATLAILSQYSVFCDTEDGRDEVEYAMYKIGWSSCATQTA